MSLSTLLGLVGFKAAWISDPVREVQSQTWDKVLSMTFTSNWNIFQFPLTQIEQDIIQKISEITPKEEIEKIFQWAKIYGADVLECGSNTSKELTKVLTSLFFDLIRKLILQWGGEAIKRKEVQKRLQSDRVINFCIESNYSWLKRTQFFSLVQSWQIESENIPEDLFVVNYLQTIETILVSYCVNGLFAAVICYRDFFDAELIEKIEAYNTKYAFKETDPEAKKETVKIWIWQDTILILDEMQKRANSKFLNEIIELLVIYKWITLYMIWILNKAAQEPSNTLAINSPTSRAMFALIWYSMKYIKSVDAKEFWDTLNNFVTKEIFWYPIKAEDASKIAKYPLWQKIHTSNIPIENRRIILNILYENRHFFLWSNQELWITIFEQILSFAWDTNKLIKIHWFLPWKKVGKIPFTVYSIIFELNIEEQWFLHTPEILQLLWDMQQKWIDLSNLHQTNKEIWEIITSVDKKEEAYIFLSEKKDNIEHYNRNLDFMFAISDDLNYLPDFYPWKAAILWLLQFSLFQNHEDFLQERNRIYNRDYSPYGSPSDISWLNRELLFGIPKELWLSILDSFYKTFYYLGKKARRKTLRQIFSQSFDVEELQILANIFSLLPEDFRYDFLLANGKEFMKRAKDTQIYTESDPSSMIWFVEIILTDLKKSPISQTAHSSENQIKNFSYLSLEIERSLRDKFWKRWDVEEFLEIINDTFWILNGMGDTFLSWVKKSKEIENPSIQHIEQIYDFFNFLHKKMHIPLVDRPEKVFIFLGTIQEQDFKNRKNKLYEFFGWSDFIPDDFEFFKGQVLKFMKNGDIDILQLFISEIQDNETKQEGSLYEHLFDEKMMKGISSRIIPLTFREIKEKLKKLWFTPSEEWYNWGSHIRFSNGEKIITIPNHPWTIRLAVIDDKRRQLGLTIKQWNAL